MAIQTAEKAAAITQYIESTIPDALMRATPTWLHLSTEGKKYQNGGLYIQYAIKLLPNASSGFISGTNALVDMTPSPQLQYGFLNWKFYNFNTNFTLQDYTYTGGATEQADYFQGKIDGSLEDSIRELSLAAHGSSSANALKIEGLLDIVAATGTSYAGLLDTDYATGSYLPVDTSDAVNGTPVTMSNVTSIINKLRAKAQQGGFSTTDYLGLMNTDTYNAMTTVFHNSIVVGANKSLEIGFTSFKIAGAEFFLDADVPGSGSGIADNYLYLLPKKFLKLYYKFGFDKKSPFDGEVRMPNQPIMSNQKYFAMNMICTNRRLVGVNKTMLP